MTENEKSRAIELLRKEFGPNWLSIVQSLGTEDLTKRVGKELTSFMAFPERGEGGKSSWRGNCSPKVVEAILKYVLDVKKYNGKDTSTFTLLDPMSGSGTSEKVANKYGIKSYLYDLNPNPACGRGNWNALKDEVDESADLIFFHPPYHDIIKYSGNMWGSSHPDDLSRCASYKEFVEKLNCVLKKLYMALRRDGRLAVLVGDIRSGGEFHSMQNDMMKLGEYESFIVKAQFNCVSDSRTYRKPFIPVVTEYMLVFRKDDIFVVPFEKALSSTFDIREKDDPSLTWHHLVRMTLENMGGEATLPQLYCALASHPKSKKNPHYMERIRATIYEHQNQYKKTGEGKFKLAYTVA